MANTKHHMSAELTPSADFAPAVLIREAMRADVSPEKLEKLLAVRHAWEADEARKNFYLMLAEFQSKAPIVEKGDDANGKPYARMDRIWRTVKPLLTEVGFSVSWQVAEIKNDEILGLYCHMEGTLAHRHGHFLPLRFNMPIPDAITNSSGKAVQNKAQVFGSALTYCERYSTCAALGIVTGEDDDGNGGVKSQLAPKEVDEIKQLLDAWRGTPGWTQEREEVFWRFTGAPKLKNGSHDLAKIAGERFGDILDLLKRSMKK